MRGIGRAGASASASEGGVALAPRSSLAERRQKLAQASLKMNMSTIKAEDKKAEAASAAKKIIKHCPRIGDFYKLGKEVMPSSNAGMDVIFAERLSDGQEVVIKTRLKGESFASKSEETEWRQSTEMLMNLPASENIA